MRMLLAALGLAVGAVHGAAAAPKPQTLYESKPHQPISAFAQDGPVLAWFEPSSTDCNAIVVNEIDNGTYVEIPRTTTDNVTCRWEVVPPVRLVVAGQSLLWTLREKAPPAPLPFDYVLGAEVSDRNERRFREIAHTAQGAGLWFGGLAGDSSTLVYAVTTVDYVDEAACLANPTRPGACALQITGGEIHRIVGRTDPVVPHTTAAVAVAAAGTDVAYVPAVAIDKHGQPLAGARSPIEIRNATTGALVGKVVPRGTPSAIALTPHLVAALELTPLGERLAWYGVGTRALIGSVPVPKRTSAELSASDRLIVFRVGRVIWGVDPSSHRVQRLTRAAATPIGLSVEGDRVAWAENVKGRGRIRDLVANPS